MPGSSHGWRSLVLQIRWMRMLDRDCGMRIQSARFDAPTEQCIPAQGATLETEMPKPKHSEGTPHRGCSDTRRCVVTRLSTSNLCRKVAFRAARSLMSGRYSYFRPWSLPMKPYSMPSSRNTEAGVAEDGSEADLTGVAAGSGESSSARLRIVSAPTIRLWGKAASRIRRKTGRNAHRPVILRLRAPQKLVTATQLKSP